MIKGYLVQRDSALLFLARMIIRTLDPKPVSVELAWSPIIGDDAMPEIHVGKIKPVGLIFRDTTGAIMDPVAGGTVNTSDPNLATAVLREDNSGFDLAGLAVGTVVVSYANGSVSTSQEVTVLAAEGGVTPPPPPPVLGSVEMDFSQPEVDPPSAGGTTTEPPAPPVTPPDSGSPTDQAPPAPAAPTA